MSTHALGIAVTAEALHAVLLERTEDETVVQLQGSLSKTPDPGLPSEDPEDFTPGVEDEPDDVTIQFGEDEGDDLFLESEFGGIGETEDEGIGNVGGSHDSWNFQAALDDLLDECAERGYEDPEIAFCTSAAEIDEVELRVPTDVEGEEQTEEAYGLSLPASRSDLLELLEEEYDGDIEEERVGFVPMHQTGDGRHRVLSLIARTDGPVLTTLGTMQEQTLSRSPRARLLDTEVSLYLGLARSALQLPEDSQEKTILVQAGEDDTLVLFIEGNTLRQAEHLPELTIDDPAETICSRVLLLQDEYGVGEVNHLLLIAEEDEELLADAFKSYFGSAHLRLLRTDLPSGDDPLSELHVAAAGAALRLLDDPERGPLFQPINLLPDRYTASTFRMPVGWSVPVLLVLLGITTLGFVWYYIANAQKISERESELRSLERQVAQVDQEALQRRIDSLKAVTTQYNEGLTVMNRLLMGSNKWSRGLASMTEQLREIGGLSVSEWAPEEEARVVVRGRANSRERAAELARQLDGEINSLAFTDVREAQLFDYEITIPLDTTKPETVTYWREQQAERLASADDATSPPDAPAEDSVASDPEREAQDRPDTEASEAEPAVASAASASEGEASPEPVWTVVVASLHDASDADAVARRFRDRLDGEAHGVQVRPSSEQSRYRVCIGTFPSFSSALAVLEKRNDLFPDGAWLYEYAPDPDADEPTVAVQQGRSDE